MSTAPVVSVQDFDEKPIRDFIIPLGNVVDDTFRLQGTGFMLGDAGTVMTAAHVSRELRLSANPIALFAPAGEWTTVNIREFEEHPLHDVAIVKLGGQGWGSILELSEQPEFSSADIHVWGYPEHVAHELRRNTADPVMRECGVNPELIFYKGYIRRRISHDLPSGVFTGDAFYEINEVCGSCCSGAPIIRRPSGKGAFKVCGVYIGEETGAARTAVGIGVRTDALRDWVPDILGRNVTAIRATHV